MIALLALLALGGPAEAKVERILSGYELAVSGLDRCRSDARLALFAQDGDQEMLGYAAVTGPLEGSPFCRAVVQTHSRSALVRAGDRTEALDLSRQADIPGRYDLVVEGERKIAARYKPLVYGGYLFGETASTLARGELLLGLSPLFYGVTDRLQVETLPLLPFAKIANLGAKYKFHDTEDVTFALLGTVNQHFDVGRRSWSASLFYDSTSNGRSMSHTTLTFTSKLPTDAPLVDKEKQQRYSAEIISTYEWVLKGWQRILLGPKFTAGETKDLGFVASAVFPYRYFHWTINVELNSITRFQFKDKKQLASFDLFWRI